MGNLTRSFANNITTSGVLTSSAITNNSIANVTSLNAAITLGSLVYINKLTPSDVASAEFTSGIDSTYNTYAFYYEFISTGTDQTEFKVNFSTDGGSTYSVNKTGSFQNWNTEDDDSTRNLQLKSDEDANNTTGATTIMADIGSEAEKSGCGWSYLHNPGSTTQIKLFTTTYGVATTAPSGNYSNNGQVSFWIDTTSAINAIKWEMSTGNIESGTIYMFGIAK